MLFATQKTPGQKSALSFHVEEMGLVANAFSRSYIIKITFQFLTSRVIGLFRDLHCRSSHKPITRNNKSMEHLIQGLKRSVIKLALEWLGRGVVERNHSIYSFLII